MNTALQHLRTWWRHGLGALATVLFLLVLAGSAAPQSAVSQSVSPLSGYMWSDTIGWISTNGGGYSVTYDPASGYLSGYAWSDNIGWVKFGGLSSITGFTAFPSGSGTTAGEAQIVSGNLTGWARACAGTASPGNCSTMASRTDGWDGWISMSGTDYGVTHNSSTGAFGGYAWGDVNVGWVDFSGVSTAPTSCTPSCSCSGNTLNCTFADCTTSSNVCAYQCAVNACIAPPSTDCSIEVRPKLIGSSNVGATVTWNVSNVKNDPASFGGVNVACVVTGTNNDGTPSPQIGWSTAADGLGNAVGSNTSSALTDSVEFTVTCMGVDDKIHSCSAPAELAPTFIEH